eukprot:TRINITY_DN41787_c0_g1_i1.p1 TRINITY_DN41787_c0_g1~~TRINITY_DN41787_c0_g1_i1.p1  ORF type:complete len:570 (+),score=148.71 TRINITY_DN41787_c0_g1_i1:91-1800(+)
MEGLRKDLEKRRREHFEKIANALAEVDSHVFMTSESSRPPALDLGLSGIIPPTTELRHSDVAGTADIINNEKKAAEQLIEEGKAQHLAANKLAAERVRQARKLATPRTTPRPWTAESETSTAVPVESEAAVPGTRCQSVATSAPSAPRTPSPWPISTANGIATGGFESDVADFHRRSEEEKQRVNAEIQKTRHAREQKAQKDFVSREHFELKHRRREVAITTEMNRLERRLIFDDNRKGNILTPLREAKEDAERQLQQRKDAARLMRAKHAAKRDRYAFHEHFVARHGVLERACRDADKETNKRRQLMTTKMHVEARKQRWQTRTFQLQMHHLHCKEQQRQKDEDERTRRKYEVALKKAEIEQDTVTKREQTKAQYAYERALREMREGMVEHSQLNDFSYSSGGTASVDDAGAGVSPAEDVLKYQDTLEAFTDMTEAVQKISKHVSDRTLQRHVSLAEPDDDDDLSPILQALRRETSPGAEEVNRQTEELMEQAEAAQHLLPLESRVKTLFALRNQSRGAEQADLPSAAESAHLPSVDVFRLASEALVPAAVLGREELLGSAPKALEGT